MECVLTKVKFASAPCVYRSESFHWSDSIDVPSMLKLEPKSILKQSNDSPNAHAASQILTLLFYAFAILMIFGLLKAFENIFQTDKSAQTAIKGMIHVMESTSACNPIL